MQNPRKWLKLDNNPFGRSLKTLQLTKGKNGENGVRKQMEVPFCAILTLHGEEEDRSVLRMLVQCK